ncbi:MAG TPA: Spy/CpxP family protein refolding chaperone [Pyrinomonadaceae bacterium]|nr:Spy/CpxP family protein refolding chaperone [Pyrinomonadaceae bacterium]
MRTRIAILIGIVALVAGGVVFVAAQDGAGQGQRPPHREGMQPPPPHIGVPDVEHLAQALSLTDAQKAELKPFLDSERETVDALLKKLGDSHQQLEAATKDGHFDEALVRTLAGQQAQAQIDLTVEHERVKARIYNVLTPEQRTKAEQMHRHGHHGPGGPGMLPPPPPRPDN